MSRVWDSQSPPGSNGESNGPDAATEALHRQVEATLARAWDEEEPSSFQDVSAYVDGMLEGVDREIFETRMDLDPGLRAEVTELIALRDAMREMTFPVTVPVAAGPARGVDTARAEVSKPTPVPVPAAPPAVRAAGRAAKRSAFSLWMIATLATAGAAAAVIVMVTWWKGVPPVPPATTHAGGSGPPAPTGAGAPSLSPPTPAPAPAPVAAGAGSAPAPPPATETTTAAILVRDAGRIIAVDTGGRLTGLPDTMTAKTDMVAQALRAGVLPGVAAHKGLGQRELTLMGDGTPQETLAVLAPIGTVVRETQPTFRWTALAGARGYVVTIYSASFDVVIASQSVRDTSWRATTALKPGAMYLWQVTANTPDGRVHAPTPPAPDARFRVMDEAARRTLERDLAGAGSSRLLAGLLFADAGLLDEADQAFTALAKENPGSEPVTRLLTRVRERKWQE